MHVCCLVFPNDSNGVVQMGIMNPAKPGEARLLEERPREKYGHSDTTDSR